MIISDKQYEIIRIQNGGVGLKQLLTILARELEEPQGQILNCLLTNFDDEVKGMIEQLE